MALSSITTAWWELARMSLRMLRWVVAPISVAVFSSGRERLYFQAFGSETTQQWVLARS